MNKCSQHVYLRFLRNGNAELVVTMLQGNCFSKEETPAKGMKLKSAVGTYTDLKRKLGRYQMEEPKGERRVQMRKQVFSQQRLR